MGHTSTSLMVSGAGIIADRLKGISGGRVLDVATGDGDFILALKRALGDYDSFVGIDVSREEIEKARENRIDAAEFRVMNAGRMEYEDASFDTVCIANSLHHLEDVGLVLAEMMRVLRPGGHFIVQESFSDGEQTEAQVSEILSHNLDADIDRLLGVTHRRTFTRGEIEGIIGAAGLGAVEVFESSRYVKCLFCDRREVCDDPLEESIVSFAIKGIEKNLERIRGHQEYGVFRVEAEKIMSRIRRTGSSLASILFIIGKKKSAARVQSR